MSLQRDLPSLASEYYELVTRAVRRCIEGAGASHVGVFLSGGLDSALLMAVLGDLRRQKTISDVTGVHLSWPGAAELRNESSAARAVGEFVGASLLEVDRSSDTFSSVVSFYGGLAFPHCQTYLKAFHEAAISAHSAGVDLLLSGAGNEAHMVGDPVVLAIEAAMKHSGPQPAAWPIGCKPEGDLPPWLAARAVEAIERAWSPKYVASPTEAVKLATIDSFNELYGTAAQEKLIWATLPGDFPPLSYPYLDRSLLEWAAPIPSRFHTGRLGGELVSKAILRVAARDRLPLDVVLRTGTIPYESVEQEYLRKDWDSVIVFMRQPWVLAALDMIDLTVLRSMTTERRRFWSTAHMPCRCF
jgi:hypothetical protein